MKVKKINIASMDKRMSNQMDELTDDDLKFADKEIVSDRSGSINMDHTWHDEEYERNGYE